VFYSQRFIYFSGNKIYLMTFDEYRRYDALELAQLVRNKEVQPAELLEVAINRAEAVNPSINAIIYPLYDLAKKMADEVDTYAPFAGVPFLLKDLVLHLKGYPLQNGCAGYKGLRIQRG
jgi:amidase